MVDGVNLYRFTRNNPLRFTDATGTQTENQPDNLVANGSSPEALKPFDESKQTTFDRHRPNPLEEQARRKFFDPKQTSPKARMIADQATKPLQDAAAREEVRLATPWQEQAIFDISKHTGGNNMARGWTGASEWAEEYSGWQQLGYGLLGISEAASLAMPAVEVAKTYQTVRIGLVSRVPAQLRGPQVGPAFRTLDKIGELEGKQHYLEVAILNKKGNEIARWVETSEKGAGFFGHTEQKALSRMNLKPGQTVLFFGEYPPCPFQGGCHEVMSRVARETGADIIYYQFPSNASPATRPYLGGVGYAKQ
jgi:hypothetical protein